MAKIEIELDELNALQARLESAQQECTRLNERLKQLNESNLVERANRLANQLTEDYIEGIFKLLGFEDNSVNIHHDLRSRFGERWYDNSAVTFSYGANVGNNFQSAFLRIGIDFDKLREHKHLTTLPELNE